MYLVCTCGPASISKQPFQPMTTNKRLADNIIHPLHYAWHTADIQAICIFLKPSFIGIFEPILMRCNSSRESLINVLIICCCKSNKLRFIYIYRRVEYIAIVQKYKCIVYISIMLYYSKYIPSCFSIILAAVVV